ncbi:DUF5050 domain-containing protein [Paenibacillus ginsengarvi]|nr:DUF5050 domain-containing protein [Paenibacillus ginsengarvi]
MRNKWMGYTLVFSLCMSLLAPAARSQAAEKSVMVTLPDFQVSLNGHKVENQYRDYPLLVYNGITYFPMTWYDSRLLGLESTWSQAEGLIIKQSPVTSSYMPSLSDRRNASVYTAEIPDTAVAINGGTIDNAKEEHPLLSFRDVTYFPLTWRFAHDQFGWDYEWGNSAGLTIRSHNPQLLTLDMPADTSVNDVALYKGYYYYAVTNENEMTFHVYRAPMQQPNDKEEIYSYTLSSRYGLSGGLSFQIRDNTLWFSYHIGGATMGHDEYVRIGDDGKAELMHVGYLNFRETPYGTLIINYGVPPRSGNLYLSPPGEESTIRKAVGDPSLMFGWHVTYGSGFGAGHDSSSPAIIGDDAYVLGSRGQTDPNKIYKINLKTGESGKVVDAEVSRFRILDSMLYYVKDADKALYASELDGTGEMLLSDFAVTWFDSAEGNVFYTTPSSELYWANPDGEDVLAWGTPVVSVQVLQDRLLCRLGENDRYGAVLLDSSSGLLLAVADPISRVLASDDGVLLQSARDSSVMLIK